MFKEGFKKGELEVQQAPAALEGYPGSAAEGNPGRPESSVDGYPGSAA